MPTVQEEIKIIKNFVRIMAEHTGSSHNLVTGLIAGLLGERLGQSFRELYLAGLLHDIGGIGAFEKLITEPLFFLHSLKEDEEITFHPEVSYRMVKEFLGLDLREIREHHELFNGDGYPGGKFEDEISTAGYILGISDKFDILSKVKQYNYYEIVNSIKEWKGRWYPPKIVEELLCLLAEDKSLLYDLHQPYSLEKRLSDIEREKDFTDLNIQEGSLLRFFSMAITLKHPYTSEHSERVSELSLKIGRYIGLNESSLKKLELSSFLHDIGKVCIPRGVLNKPTALSPAEARIIMEHSLKTYEILNNSSMTEDIAFIASSHHEAMDGSGYPLGLRGDEIPLMSRIINIVDIYDALTSHRAYREALSRDNAINLMEKEFKGKIDYELFFILKKILKEEEVRE